MSVTRRDVVSAGMGVMLGIPAASASGRIEVVATTSDVATFVAAVGGELVHVRTIVPPMIDGEAFEPRASDLVTLSDADLVVRVGLGYDAWLDKLTSRLRRPELWRGGERVVDASTGVPLLEVSGRDPYASDGHAHSMANPHYWLDPVNAETMTATMAQAIVRIAPGARDSVTANRNRFLADLHERLTEWTRQLASARGTAVLTYHNSWPYFARRFRLNVVGFIEEREGVAPSAAHLSEVIALARSSNVRAILQKTDEPKRFSEMLSARLGIPLVFLAPTVGSVPQASDYLSFMDYNVGVLVRALAAIDPATR